jgi:alpha-amylase/alpha-mannosidase (GH57 family)
VNEVAQLAHRYADSPNHAVVIALDGENAWEHYPFNGYYFLRALYASLANHPLLELTTLSDCLARGVQPAPLSHVMAGSWVHGTLATWMGAPEKNRAWDLLCEAKLAFDRVTRAGSLNEDQKAAAGRQLALCESSDWFWWFGDYNPQDAVTQFDRLYRRQLVNLYRLLDIAPPESLSQPISMGRGAPEHGGVMRRANA